MYLRDQNKNQIAAKIIAEGEEKFLDALCIGRVKHKGAATKCPVCQKQVGLKGRAWMLTDTIGVPMFDDRFDTDTCANLAIKWMRGLLAAFKRYVGSENEEPELTEDDLRDPIAPKDNESLKDYFRRYGAHMEHLKEVTPEISEGDRLEDHQ